MKIIFGLGNPGLGYRRTRHNAGFRAVDEIAREKKVKFSKDRDFRAYEARASMGGEQVILVKPLSYMNLSGAVVSRYRDYYDLDVSDIIVIVDDIYLAAGSIRIRAKGGSGGHNGLESIENGLGTGEFIRIRVGVGSENVPSGDKTDYVLGNFTREEEKVMSEAVKEAASAAEAIVAKGLTAAMNEYNKKR